MSGSGREILVMPSPPSLSLRLEGTPLRKREVIGAIAAGECMFGQALLDSRLRGNDERAVDSLPIHILQRHPHAGGGPLWPWRQVASFAVNPNSRIFRFAEESKGTIARTSEGSPPPCGGGVRGGGQEDRTSAKLGAIRIHLARESGRPLAMATRYAFGAFNRTTMKDLRRHTEPIGAMGPRFHGGGAKTQYRDSLSLKGEGRLRSRFGSQSGIPVI